MFEQAHKLQQHKLNEHLATTQKKLNNVLQKDLKIIDCISRVTVPNEVCNGLKN